MIYKPPLAILLFVAALCASVPVAAQTRMTAAEKATCVAAGGRLGTVGMLQHEVCIRKMKDAGKRCVDGKQCEAGTCQATRDMNGPVLEPGKKVAGICAATDAPSFGCNQTVNRGRANFAICAD